MTIEITPAVPAAAVPVPASDPAPAPAPADANANNPAPVESKEQQPAPVANDAQKEERRKSAIQRINELTSQKHEFRRAAEEAWRENAQLRKQLEELAADPALDDVSRVRAAVKSEKLEDTHNRAKQADAVVSALRAQSFAANVELARETVPDIDQTLATWFNWPLAEAAQDLIAESENGALVAYHLARNPHVQQRINSLPPHMIGREIARIEAQIAPYPVKRISQAPPPVQTVSGNAATGAPDPEKMDQRTYEKWRESQMRA